MTTAWRLEYLADGIAFVPRDGLRDGAIRIREHQRPLTSVKQIFDRAAARLPVPPCDAGPIERLVTCEGEHAAFQVRRGELAGGVPYARCFGVVFGDDAYSLVDAGTTVPDRFPLFERTARDLTYYCSLGLGHLRHRRYFYTPPSGWEGLARGLETRWAPAGDPHSARILVHAARPEDATSTRDAIVERLARVGLGELELAAPVRLFARSGLSGPSWTVERGPVTVHLAILEDERFVYPLELVTRGPGAARSFEQVVHSVQPIPLPAPQPQPDHAMHWAL